jgi:hypothetical protein
MKSAYELAMDRLEKNSPATNLSNEQKARLAVVDQEITAKIAEKRIFLEDQIAKAAFHEQEAIRQQLASEITRLEQKREHEKEKIRNESQGEG